MSGAVLKQKGEAIVFDSSDELAALTLSLLLDCILTLKKMVGLVYLLGLALLYFKMIVYR